MAKYKLPDLPYDYRDLEPYIDSKTVEIHHSKHHQAYVDGLNATLDKLVDARKESNFGAIKSLKKDLAFHGSGHFLHDLYWKNLCPSSICKEYPSGKLFEAIESKFVSFGTFLKEFKAATLTVEGSGWGILAIVDGELEILTIEKHQDLSIIGAIPIMVCDVWEHAYYLNYQNKRAEYIDNFFKVINWEEVEMRYKKNL